MTNQPRQHAPHLHEPLRYREGIDLAAHESATTTSRHFVRTTLHDWGASSALDDALLVSNELVTNAIKACQRAASHGRWTVEPVSKLIRLRLLGLAHSIVIEVWDRAPDHPVMKPFNLEDTSGRGLYIVESMALRWGFYPMRPRPGKVVWADLAVPAAKAVSA